MKARYTVIDGEIISETRGATERTYVPDAIGNTVALLNDSATVTDTFSYWPYGEVKTRTGSTPTPFQFRGTGQCYRDGTLHFVNPVFVPKIADWLNEAKRLAALLPKKKKKAGCDCEKMKAINVKGPTRTISPRGTPGIPIEGRMTRQDCYDINCRLWCMTFLYYQGLEFDCRRGGVYSGWVSHITSSLPPCTKENPYWKKCAIYSHLDRKGGARANLSDYPTPTSQNWFGTNWFGDYCNLECQMRVCCAWEKATAQANESLKREFADCDKVFRAV